MKLGVIFSMSESALSQRYLIGMLLASLWSFLLTYSTLKEQKSNTPATFAIEEPDRSNGYAADHDKISRLKAPGSSICIEGNDCTQKDLYQQWRAAEGIRQANGIAILQFALAAAGTVLLWYGLILNRDATRAATDAAKTARLQFEEADRPLFFVAVSDHTFRTNILVYDPLDPFSEEHAQAARESDKVDIAIRLKNVGTRPAFAHSLIVHAQFISDPKRRKDAELLGQTREIDSGVEITCHRDYQSVDQSALIPRIESGETFRITGILTYEDALGIFREKGFGFDATTNSKTDGEAYFLNPIRWVRCNDPRIAYEQRIKPKPGDRSF